MTIVEYQWVTFLWPFCWWSHSESLSPLHLS